nr:glutamate racemase [Synechocystis sp. PCC 7509]
MTATPGGAQSACIGIFDSGVGGLTVLNQVARQLPNESIVYFGDTARVPYGTRSSDEILQFVREIISWMLQQQAKMVIMACNTSSALVLRAVQTEFPIPIVGTILPGSMAAAKLGRRIGVIATPATVASNAYKQAILAIDPTVQVWQVACPEFVPLIEQNRVFDPYTAQIAQQYLAPLLTQKIDTLVYGCTHYPHLEPVLRLLLPPTVKLLDPAIQVVATATQQLDLLGLTNTNMPTLPTRFYVSGCPQNFAQSAQLLLGFMPIVENISLT